MSHSYADWSDLRPLKNIILHLLLFTTVLEHLLQACHSTHDYHFPNSSQLWKDEVIGIGDARHVLDFRNADKGPECGAVHLRSNIVGDTNSASILTSRNLSSRDG